MKQLPAGGLGFWFGVLIVTLVAVAVRLPAWSDFTPGADEKDYRRAAREGFWSMYAGTNTVSLPRIVERYRAEPGFRDHPWATLMAEGEQLAVRHFHVPLAFYPSAAFGDRAISNRAHRVFPLLFSAVCAPLVLAGLWSFGVSPGLSLLGALLVAVDRRAVIASRIVTPHPLYLLLTLAFLFAWAALLVKPSSRRRLLAIILLAAAWATLEFSPLLMVTAALTAWLHAPAFVRAFPTARDRWLALLTFAIVVLVAWPAGVLQLGYATAYGMFAALALFHREEYYGEAGLVPLYQRLFANNLPLAICALAGLVAAFRSWRNVRRDVLLSVVTSYAVLAVAFNWLNRFRNATYAAEATVPLWLLFAVALHALSSRGATRRVAVVALAVLGWIAVALETAAAF